MTGTGKPRLTAETLAKVPSEKRSTKDAWGEKSASKKTGSNKPAKAGNTWDTEWGVTGAKSNSKKSGSKNDSKAGGNTWDTVNVDAGGWNDESGDKNAKSESNKSGSQKTPSKVVDDPWTTGGGGGGADATGTDDKKDDKKDDNAAWDDDLWAMNGGTSGGGPVETTDDKNKKEENNTQAAASTDEKKDGEDNTHGWTKEEDEKLLELKAECKSWADITELIKKDKSECTQRFKQIKPDGWRPNGKGGGGDGGANKKVKKDEGNKNWNQGGNNKRSNKEEESKEEVSGGDATDTLGMFGTIGLDGNDDSKDDATKDAITAIAGTIPIEGTKNNNNRPTTAKSNSQKAPSNKAPSNKPASTKADPQQPTSRPLELELKPDDVFSADDLRLVAKILQQDCSLVWNRLSWRFRDKTGRTLHPDWFEKKIMGAVEGKK
jgi:hypothetical protein